MHPGRDRRRGTALVMFAMIAFGLLALAAIVLDLGQARLKQAEAQAATDHAALEELRWLNETPPADFAPDPSVTLEAGVLLQPPDLNPAYPPTAPRDEMIVGGDTYIRRDFRPPIEDELPTAVLARTRREVRVEDTTGMLRDRLDPRRPAPWIVRATSIADSRPALSVGPAFVDEGIPGVTPFLIEQSAWVTAHEQFIGGQSPVSATVQGWTGAGAVASVGQKVETETAVAPTPTQRYLPVYREVERVNRIVGFVPIRDASLSGTTLTFTPGPELASRNATATLLGSPDLPGKQLDLLVRRLVDPTDPDHLPRPLRAPALAQRHIGPNR